MPKSFTKTTWNKEPKKVKPKTISISAKNKERSKDKPYRVAQADKWFSYYIRLFYSDKMLRIICYTCGKSIFWRDAHNCHREERGNYATRRELDNCRAWCAWCNQYHKERHKRIMTMKLAREIGLERLEELHNTKRDLQRLNVIEIKEKALYWKEKAEDLAEKLWVDLAKK